MRILLDESVPHKLRLLIGDGHEVATTWYLGWSGMKNGALMEAAEGAGFDVLITADQEMRYQQNWQGRAMGLLVLSTNDWARVKAHHAEILEAPRTMAKGAYCEVVIPGAE